MRVDNLPDKLKIEEQNGYQNGFTDDSKALSNAKDGVTNSESATLQKVERLKTIDADDIMSGLSFKDIFPMATNAKNEAFTKEFLQSVLEILWNFIRDSNNRDASVLKFHHPEQLMNMMDFSLPEAPRNLQQILSDCKHTLNHQVKTGHPHFFNQLSQGLDIISMAGEWLAATANTNMFTYEIAPVFIMMEHEVLNKMREIIGFHAGDSILAPGGSISNMYALIIARHRLFPQHKHEGMRAIHEHLVVYTSEECHYSIRGGCATIGLGLDNCCKVACDERGRMRPDKLEDLILRHKAEGKTPFFVNATAGTTVKGAFDPIDEIANICNKHDLWLHVDAAWGGGLLMSETFRKDRFLGVERADSLTWNPHKLLGALLQCSTFHLKVKGVLNECNTMAAEYLFQTDKHYDVQYDTGDKVIQCGRHNDIFKFWLMWRAKGTIGLGEQMDRMMQLTRYQVEKMKQEKDRFYLLDDDPQCVNVCFWYIPERLRKSEHTKQKEIELGVVTAKLKSIMMEAGTLMVSYQPLGELPNFFRSIISNVASREEDIDFMLSEMERLGKHL